MNTLSKNIGTFNSVINSNSGNRTRGGSMWSWFVWIVVIGIIASVIALGVIYRDTIKSWFQPAEQQPSPPAEKDASHVTPNGISSATAASASDIIEKVLPSMGNSEVFNVSSNKYTYYDAEPLCRALGAELATYEKVKEAWEKGADWCNYGWVKGQMAVFPTQKSTYEKLQHGPPEQSMTCGKPGVNGGFFDNPELRFGVNCYGPKPPKSQHDDTSMSAGIPLSPDALEVDKKVAQFKAETGSIGLLPFNSNTWSN